MVARIQMTFFHTNLTECLKHSSPTSLSYGAVHIKVLWRSVSSGKIPSGRQAGGVTQSNNQHNIGAVNSQQGSVQGNPNNSMWFLIMRNSDAIYSTQKSEAHKTQRVQ